MKLTQKTIFNIPVLSPFLHGLSLFILSIFRWKIRGTAPAIPKYVMIAAPHTSNWDFVMTLLMALALKMDVYIMGKKELTEWPLGFTFKWMGVIPVDRSQASDTVASAVQCFRERSELILLVPPSGTRKKVTRWKTGFYHIANEARVPIALGFLDYGTKTSGVGPLFHPTGNIDADMPKIRAFYAPLKGKNES